jgi:hypothetical protein
VRKAGLRQASRLGQEAASCKGGDIGRRHGAATLRSERGVPESARNAVRASTAAPPRQP